MLYTQTSLLIGHIPLKTGFVNILSILTNLTYYCFLIRNIWQPEKLILNIFLIQFVVCIWPCFRIDISDLYRCSLMHGIKLLTTALNPRKPQSQYFRNGC